MATRAWNAGDPAGSDAANTIDDAARRIRQDLLERGMQGGQKFAGTTPPAPSAAENNDGKVCVGYETQTHQDDTGYVTLAWDFAGTTRKVRQYGGSHATQPNQFELAGDIVDQSGNFLTKGGIAVAAFLRAVVGDPSPVATTYLKRVFYKVPSFTSARSRKLTKVKVIVGTKPLGADLVVNVRQLAAPADGIDRFNDANSTVAGTVTLTAASGNFAAETTGLAVTLATDDELVIKYGTVGTTTIASDVTIICQIE